MPRQLKDAFPPPDILLGLDPEEVASFLLDYLCELEEGPNPGKRQLLRRTKWSLNQYNFTLSDNLHPYAENKAQEVAQAITVAWEYLRREGMLAPKPGDPTRHWEFVTPKGFRFRKKQDLEAYKKGHLLPKENLDKVLLDKAYPLFIRGEYEQAVFQSYKAVEIKVREKAGYSTSSYGVNLMRDAFHAENGPLADKTAQKSERDAMRDLFVGSIGLFKNPSSHRNVDYNRSGEASELILFANYLLHLAEKAVTVKQTSAV